VSINAQADGYPYNEILTAFGVEHGVGGPFVCDDIAVPFTVKTQDYSIPQYTTARVTQGKIETKAKGDGSLNVRTSASPTFNPGKCHRRGLKSFIDLETKAAPTGMFFADEEIESANNIDDLKLERELGVKAALDAVQSVANHNLSPTYKWDDTTQDPGIITVMEAALRQAELNSGWSIESGFWRWYVPTAVADVIKQYLRVKLLYTDGDFQVNGRLPRTLAGVPAYTCGSMQDSAAMGAAPSTARIWNSDDVYLVYVNPGFAQSRRAFTALAQPRWNAQEVRGVSSDSYAVQRWRDPAPDIYRIWVAADIYDNLETVSQDGIYVLKHVLTTETP